MFYPMKKIISAFFLLLSGLSSCMKYGPMEEEEIALRSGGVFITNEGNFMYGTASLSYYDPSGDRVENEVFIRSNGINLGDVAQSMAVRGGTGYIVVNNSGVIFAVDLITCKIKGALKGLPSPRYIHFISDDKAYATDLYASRITVFDPRTMTVTGYVDLEGYASSSEQMVEYGGMIFVNCWRGSNKILVIDPAQDIVADEIEVGNNPRSMTLDRHGKLWVAAEGGGNELPSLWRLDASARQVEKVFYLAAGGPVDVKCDATGSTLYYIDGSVWRMDAKAETLPADPFIEDKGTIFFALGIDPRSSEIYVSDAVDYVQPGVIHRFSPQGSEISRFRVGVNPGGFCFWEE